MFLPSFSIHRPVAATMMIAILVVFGLISVNRLGISLFPDVEYPVVSVSTTWENARPEEVDNEITDKLEDAVSGVSGIKHITSQSMQSRSRISVEFELTKNVDVAAQEVRDKVSAKIDKIPLEADAPIIDKLDANAQPIIQLSISGQYAIDALTKIADEQIRPMLQKIQGVGEVRLGGARKKEIHLRLYRERLAAYELGVNQVIDAVRSQHIEIPGGKIESDQNEYLIRTMGEFKTAEAFNDLIIDYRNGVPIRLKQVGYAISAREESMGIAKFTSREMGTRKTVSLGICPRSGANQVAIARSTKAMLPEIERVLPEGMAAQIAVDSSLFIEKSINEVRDNLVEGGIIAALVIFFFLQNFRTTLISAISIPTSIISTFACMYMMGFTMNNMTMLGLTVAVGIVIDDSIVMVENIFRHRHDLKKSAFQAAMDGSAEVAFAVVSTTVVLAGVFLPVAFMGSMIGRYFYEFAITVAFSIAISMLVSLSLVPMMSSRFMTVNLSNFIVFRIFEAMMDGSIHIYRAALGWFLRWRFIMIFLAIIVLVYGGWLYTIIGKEFIASEDQSRLNIRVEAPLSYSIDKMDSVMTRMIDVLNSVPEVHHYYTVSGIDGSNKGMARLTLLPKNERTRSQKEIQAEIRSKLKNFPDIKASVTDISPLGGQARNEDIQFVIQGPNIEDIDKYSKLFINRLNELSGYVGITRDLEIGKPEVRVKIDREKAADLGISVKEIASAIGALLGGVKVSEFKEGGKSYEIRVRLEEEQRFLPEDISRIWLRTTAGMLIDISNLVTLEEGVGPSVINRLDRQRSATIYAALSGKLLGDAMVELEQVAHEILPEGYSTKFSGKAESMNEAGYNIFFAFLLSIILTYMILAAQFESFVHPLSIMMGLPLSFIGAFGFLILLDNTLNLFSMIGLVLLVGLVTKNGILLIEFTNQLRAKGLNVHDALVEAGATRLRPILMTAVATIGGVIPVVLGLGEGSESRQPMGVAIAGGIFSSTFLTLTVVPVVYSCLEQMSHWRIFDYIKKKAMAGD